MSSAIDTVTESMAAATINEPTNGTTTAAATSAQNDAAMVSADEGRRLYIGNLAYATTEGELKEFFSGYSIESTSIPVNPRTNRPVGYAFVDLSTANEAQDAIAALSGKEILERKVSVQVARKPEPADAKGEGATSGGEGASGGEGRKRGSGRGRGRGRGRGGRGGRGGRANAQTGENAGEAPLNDVTNEANAEAGTEASKDANQRGNRAPRQRGPPEDGIPSKTKVMVANLPYDLTEDKLKELFAAYEPVSAKIALRPIPRFMVKKLQARNEPRKGRGFGFVTLGSEALQEQAVNEMNEKEIEGRQIAVKVAIDSPGKEDDAVAEHAAEHADAEQHTTSENVEENAAPAEATATETPAAA